MSLARGRRQQYSDETREALLTAARALFLDQGFAGTKLADVAAEAEVTRGAVYHHFKDKQDLFLAVFEWVESEGMDAVRDAYLAHEDPVDGAFAAMGAYLDHGMDTDYAQIVLRQGPIALGWEQWKICEQKYAAGLLEQVITSLVSSGRFPPLPITTTASITYNALGGCALAIAGAEPADRERVRTECGEVMVRLLSGLLV